MFYVAIFVWKSLMHINIHSNSAAKIVPTKRSQYMNTIIADNCIKVNLSIIYPHLMCNYIEKKYY